MRSLRSWSHHFLVACLAAALGACAPGHDGHGSHDAGSMDLLREKETAGGTFVVRYTPSPDPIPLNEPFDLTLEVERKADGAAAEGVTVSVDARMPAHNHGMNTTPQVTEQGGGTYLVDGMLFHMPGHWELYVEVEEGGSTERATFDVMLEE